MGDRIPDLYGSIGTDLTWKGLSLSVLTTYSIGGKVYDSLYAGSMNNMYFNTNFNAHALRRWQKPGDITDVPRMEVGGSYATTDRFLVDASYFAIKNITLGYTFDKPNIKARIYATVQNPFVITGYKGLDPEVFGGIDNNIYPRSMTSLIGVSLQF